MWQKIKGKYCLIPRMDPAIQDGRFLQTACGHQVQVRKRNQVSYTSYGQKQCEICTGVWFIIFTSVDDAKSSIWNQTNLKVLRRALEMSDRKTLTQSLERRIKYLEAGS